jgi:3-hydroxyacyl-[acyl-carrier-protein] dehydratase
MIAPDNVSTPKMLLGPKDILKILPHRYPFLLVDKIIELDLEQSMIVGQKNVTINEPFFQGHFPEAPIMPGMLILEALAQTGGILAHQKGYSEKIAVFLNVSNAKFRHPVRPGDTLLLRVIGLHFSQKGGRVKAEALVNDKVAVEAEISYAFVLKSQL